MRHWPVAESGTRQSPIDLNRTAALGASNGGAFLHRGVEWKYQKSKIEMVNNGHTIQANFTGEHNNTLTLGGNQYKLKQFHFHHRSEHLIDGKSAPMEVHLVHEQLANDKKYAVIGVLIKEGKAHHDIEHWWDHLPKPGGHGDKHEKKETGAEKKEEEKAHEFNPASLLPVTSGYFQYEGSLTTPPCTENVFWTVMENPIYFSSEQIEAFRKMFPNNRRAPQPLKGRPVIRRIGVAP